jgi:hypothetical protein
MSLGRLRQALLGTVSHRALNHALAAAEFDRALAARRDGEPPAAAVETPGTAVKPTPGPARQPHHSGELAKSP